MDAAQHKEAEILDPEEKQEVGAPPPQAYPDLTSQLTDVVPEPNERIAKDVYGEGKTLLNYLHAPKLKEAILMLQRDHPEYLVWDEPTFKKKHRELITLVTQRLRIALWQEFELAVLNNRTIRIKQIYAGICTEKSFHAMIENPVRLAYVLLAPTDYVVMLKEAHEAGLDKLRELFSAKIVDEEGYVNPKAADVVLKAFALIDARLKGAIVQRVDQRVLTASIVGEAGKQIGIPSDMEQIEQELARVRKQIESYTHIPHPRAEEVSELSKDVELTKIEYKKDSPKDGGRIM